MIIVDTKENVTHKEHIKLYLHLGHKQKLYKVKYIFMRDELKEKNTLFNSLNAPYTLTIEHKEQKTKELHENTNARIIR